MDLANRFRLDFFSFSIGMAVGGSLVAFTMLLPANSKHAYYQGRPVKILSERCDSAWPHHCRTTVDLGGASFEVSSDELERK